MNTSIQAQVFISYSHKDRKFLEEFREHLVHLERHRLVNFWSDENIRPGQKWKKEIEQAITSAKVAVLFVSRHFLASNFIAQNELPVLLSKSKAEGTLLLAIITWPCRYDISPGLADLQALNDPKKPLGNMRPADREELYVEATKEIENALNSNTISGGSLKKVPHDKGAQSASSAPGLAFFDEKSGGINALIEEKRNTVADNERFRMLILRQRLQKYSRLWQMTEVLPKWPKNKNVTYKKLEELSLALRDWYFKDQGGLYLTRESHIAYSALQDHLSELEKSEGRLSGDHYDLIRGYCSKLRTQLAEDVQTRRRLG